MSTPSMFPSSVLSLGTVVLVSDDEASEAWLRRAIGPAAVLQRVPADATRLGQRLAAEQPGVVVIDFGRVTAHAAELAQGAAQACPDAVLVAMGRAAEGGAALAALRAGAREFIDTDGSGAEILSLLIEALKTVRGVRAIKGQVVALAGARAGVGSSTLAAHLAVMLQRALRPARNAALLDLGVPVGDSLVLLETRGSYSLAEAARNQHRIDTTFVQSALPRHASGLAVLSLPASVAELRELTHAAAVSVIQRLRGLVDLQVVDLGGFTSMEFIAQVAAISDHCLVVCDQGAPSVLSAVEVARSLKARGVRPRLVMNKVDPAVEPQPEQVAARLELPLAGVLPQRSTALLRALNGGKLLSEVAPQDPYVRAVRQLAQRLLPDMMPAEAAAGGVVHALHGLTRRWSR